MKRLLFFFLLISGFAHGQGYVNIRETQGGNWSYRRLLSTDIPLSLNYRYLKRYDTTNLKGAAQRTWIVVDTQTEDNEESSIFGITVPSLIGYGAKMESYKVITDPFFLNQALGMRFQSSNVSGGTEDYASAGVESGTNGVYAYLSGQNKANNDSTKLIVTSGGVQFSTTNTSNGFGEVADYSAGYTARSYTAKSYVDAKIAQTITNSVTTSAPSQDAVFDALALKAPLASPALTGVPTAPTASPGTNTTQIASTAFVTTAVAGASGYPGPSSGTAGDQLRWDAGGDDLENFTPLADPTTTDYDMLFKLSGEFERLPKGSNGQFLSTQSSALAWANSLAVPTSTGTGTSSGFNVVANSLTTGNAVEFSSSSITSGNVLSVAATGTAAASNTKVAGRFAASGANGTSTQSTFAGVFTNTSTGTSSTNVGGYFSASGGTNNYGIQLAGGQFLQQTTQGFATSVSLQSVTNNSNEVYSLSSSGNPLWNLYNTSGTKTGDVQYILAGGTSPGLVIRNGGATTRYNLVHDPANDAFGIYENTVANTKVMIGGVGVPSATLEVQGRANTTALAFKVGNSAQSTRFSVADDGTIGHQGPIANFGNGASTAGVIGILEDTDNGTNYTRFTVGVQSADITYTLPTALPAVTSALITTSTGTMGTLALAQGTYTPTLSNTTNVAGSTAYVTGYYRVGGMVTVSGKIDIDATLAASTATELGISLPIASNLVGEEDAGGAAVSDSVASLSARIKADATNDRVSVVFKALSLANDSYSFEFSYQVK